MARLSGRKTRKITAAVICILAFIYSAVLFAAGNFIYVYFLEKNILSSDSPQNSGAEESNKTNWLTQNAKSLYISSEEGLKLHGFFVKTENTSDKYVIICHGYTSRASHMSGYANRFYQMGFNVLAVDARAHGESEGSVRGMGCLEKRDILLWINEILKMNKNARIVLYGVSMGAATVMMTAGESELPDNVVCIIEDCGYTSVYDEIAHQIKKHTPIPAFPLADAASLITKIRGGYSFRQASCIDAVKRCQIPVLFIHGSEDDFVPFSMLDNLYNAAACEKQKLVVQGAVHAQSASHEPALYWDTVEKFCKKYCA